MVLYFKIWWSFGTFLSHKNLSYWFMSAEPLKKFFMQRNAASNTKKNFSGQNKNLIGPFQLRKTWTLNPILCPVFNWKYPQAVSVWINFNLHKNIFANPNKKLLEILPCHGNFNTNKEKVLQGKYCWSFFPS